MTNLLTLKFFEKILSKHLHLYLLLKIKRTVKATGIPKGNIISKIKDVRLLIIKVICRLGRAKFINIIPKEYNKHYLQYIK